ncbi:DUF1802 family protein [Lyngbya aestuarii]|uniref:DUF1802 family protein n=1 Tax=Lyngbya aestuarii TaxID=118322 RepID=UPI00403DC0FD
MSQQVSLPTALSLTSPDVEALIQGRMIAAMPRIFVNPGRQFALYPCDTLSDSLPPEQYYRSSFLPIAQRTLAKLSSDTVLIKAWARCELCQMLNNPAKLESLSHLTVWTTEALQQILLQRPHIFLVHLRVYLLPQPIELPVYNQERHFVPLPRSLSVSEAMPVLNDRIFSQRRRQLEKLEPPQYPELEELQSAIAKLSINKPAAAALDQNIKTFLGWDSTKITKQIDSDLAWIQTIANVGNSSDGQTFEKLVRRSLLKLGFTGSSLAPDSTGGAGGMDFYCEAPYPIVGECKATKTEKVTDGAPAQLLKIGMNHLGKAQYERSIKLIVAAGELNKHALRTATENQMNVIRPETLQRLVELHAEYQGSVDLLELKQCLQQTPFGSADDKVNGYIDKAEKNIKLRSHIVKLVKDFLERANQENAGIDELYGGFVQSNPPQASGKQELLEILIELSSPLIGYLGRTKGSSGNYHFYFRRDLG